LYVIEDFLTGFYIGGIATVIYEEVYKKHLSKGKFTFLPPKGSQVFLFGFPLTFFVLFFILDVESFYTTSATSLIFYCLYVLYEEELNKKFIF